MARQPGKTIVSLRMGEDIYTAIAIVAKCRGSTVTSLILDAIAEKLQFTLDSDGSPKGLDLVMLAKDAIHQSKKTVTKRTKTTKGEA